MEVNLAEAPVKQFSQFSGHILMSVHIFPDNLKAPRFLSMTGHWERHLHPSLTHTKIKIQRDKVTFPQVPEFIAQLGNSQKVLL